jgi:hypothetical protein
MVLRRCEEIVWISPARLLELASVNLVEIWSQRINGFSQSRHLMTTDTCCFLQGALYVMTLIERSRLSFGDDVFRQPIRREGPGVGGEHSLEMRR